MILKKETFDAYNRTRSSSNNKIVCHAPSTNLNFEQTGEVRACCYNYTNIVGKWPDQSIKQIWLGPKLKELKDYIADNNFGGGCKECGRMIVAGNYQGVRAKYYDEFATHPIKEKINNLARRFTGSITYPKVMEFELSNQCNLECVMCNGNFSSSIRKNREKLPPVVSPYNEKFVDELEEFIPHLTDAKFLGGEPFMIDIYLSIWERIRKIKPGIRIHITTNGTFLNNRIKELLEGLNAGIILSIDSINPETYRKIRVNGNFEKVMENLSFFLKYTKAKKTFISMAVCPITYNWKELPEMFEFCLAKNISLYFNAVFTPRELSLREQSAEYLREVITYLENYNLPKVEGSSLSARNLSIRAFNDFINLLKGWLHEKERWNEQVDTIQTSAIYVEDEKRKDEWSLTDLAAAINALNAVQDEDQYQQMADLQVIIGNLLAHCPADKLPLALMAYFSTTKSISAPNEEKEIMTKLELVASLINNHPHRNEILKKTGQAPPTFFVAMIQSKSLEELKSDLLKFFSA